MTWSSPLQNTLVGWWPLDLLRRFCLGKRLCVFWCRTLGQNDQESRSKYWATRLFVRSCARSALLASLAHFAHSQAHGTVNDSMAIYSVLDHGVVSRKTIGFGLVVLVTWSFFAPIDNHIEDHVGHATNDLMTHFTAFVEASCAKQGGLVDLFTWCYFACIKAHGRWLFNLPRHLRECNHLLEYKPGEETQFSSGCDWSCSRDFGCLGYVIIRDFA